MCSGQRVNNEDIIEMIILDRMSFAELYSSYTSSKSYIPTSELQTELGATYDVLTKYESDLDAYNPTIETIAGDTTAAYLGDYNAGIATSAQLNRPYNVAVDSSGNIYIADRSNHCIRRVNTSGIITTVAGTGTAGSLGDGGNATSAQLSSPTGVAVDLSGNIYIADTWNHRIRKITVSTGIITTIAGTGTNGFSGDGSAATSALLYSPDSVVLDSMGNVYITDTWNNCIRKITVSTGIITTIAGTGGNGAGFIGFTGDGGVATSAKLNYPSGVALDLSGNVYIADQSNNCIRKITVSNDIITTIAGTGTAGSLGDGGVATSARLWNPSGVALDLSGNVYIADQSNNCIRKITVSTGIITTIAGTGIAGFLGDGGVATSARLWKPSGVALDLSGNVYIADTWNNCIRKITVSTGIITTIAGTGTAGFSGDYNTGDAKKARLNNGDIKLDSIGNLYITDLLNNLIRKIDTSGIITTIAGPGTVGLLGDNGPAISATLDKPFKLDTDLSGNIYIADRDNHRIRKITVSTGIITTIAGTGIAGFLGDGGAATFARLRNPSDVALDLSGNIYILDTSNNRIRKINTDGVINTIAGNGSYGNDYDKLATTVPFYNPIAAMPDMFGNIYIIDQNAVKKINNAGVITLIAGTVGTTGFSGDGGAATSESLFNSPSGIALDKAGNIYIADTWNNRIRKITVSTGTITTIAGTGTAGSLGDGGPATSALLWYPKSLALDSIGNIYLLSSNIIRRINVVLKPPVVAADAITSACQKIKTLLINKYNSLAPSYSISNSPSSSLLCASSDIQRMTELISSMKLAITNIKGTYNANKQSLTSKGASIPANADINSASQTLHQSYMDMNEPPFLLHPISAIPVLTANTTTISGNIYTVTTSTNAQNPSTSYTAFNDIGSPGWMKGTSDASPFIQIQLPAEIVIHGYVLQNNDYTYGSFSTYKFEASNNGSTWTALDTATSKPYNSNLINIIYFPTNTTAYKYYKFSYTHFALAGGSFANITSRGVTTYIRLFTNTVVQPTKQDQLQQIYNKYNDANNILQDISLADSALSNMRTYYVDTYIPYRKYLKSTQFTANMQAAVTLCAKYITTSGALITTPLAVQGGDTFSGIVNTCSTQTTEMIRAIINGYQTTYNEWSGRIPNLSTTDPVPATLASDALAATTALRDSYVFKWDSIIGKIKQKTINMLQSAQALTTWKTTATNMSVTVDTVSTKGLGM
jgi:sugar lactone lactonase YvrE